MLNIRGFLGWFLRAVSLTFRIQGSRYSRYSRAVASHTRLAASAKSAGRANLFRAWPV